MISALLSFQGVFGAIIPFSDIYVVPQRRRDGLAKKAEAKPKQIKVNVGGEKTLEAKAPGKAA